MPYRKNLLTQDVLIGGALAGMLSGLGMKILAMINSMISGDGLSYPFQLIAATLHGVDAMIGGIMVAIVGFLIHMAVSTFFGIAFAALIDRNTRITMALLGGLFFGFCIWVFMTYLVLPLFDPVMRTRVDLMQASWFVEHLVFGGLLMITPMLRRNFTRRTEPAMIEPAYKKAS